MAGIVDPRLRFRFFIGGKLVMTDWLDCSQPNVDVQAQVIRDTHNLLIDLANDQDQFWMAEIFDPEEDDDNAYLRLGTDKSLMEDPRQLEV